MSPSSLKIPLKEKKKKTAIIKTKNKTKNNPIRQQEVLTGWGETEILVYCW